MKHTNEVVRPSVSVLLCSIWTTGSTQYNVVYVTINAARSLFTVGKRSSPIRESPKTHGARDMIDTVKQP